MVVMTAKVNKPKLIAVICILAAIICIAAVVLGGGADTEESTPVNTKVNTNEARLAYLAEFGWAVDAQPVEAQDVMIPEEMNEVLQKYNELQRSQGFDLTRFAGKQVKRYVYTITNYEGAAEPVYATLLIYKDAVIGGDVTSTGGAGLMHGFAKPTSTQLKTEEAAAEQGAPDSAAEEQQEAPKEAA